MKYISGEVKDSDIGLINRAFKIITHLELTDDSLYFDDKAYIEFREDLLMSMGKEFIKDEKQTRDQIQTWLNNRLNKAKPDYRKLLELEAESYYLGILDIQHHSDYKTIRCHLTREEKRCFVLCWFMRYTVLGKPSPRFPFGNMIPTFHRMFVNFWDGMNEHTRWLILKGVIYKDKTILRELSEAWKSFLRFYPIWLAIVRSDDAESKKSQRKRLKTDSINAPLIYGEELTKDTLKMPNSENKELLPKLISKENFEELLKFCSPKQANIISLKFLDGLTQEQIAKKLEITQPAIAKNLKAGLKAIKEGIKEDNYL